MISRQEVLAAVLAGIVIAFLITVFGLNPWNG